MDSPEWRETQVDFSPSRQSFASTGVSTSLARASGSNRIASTHSSWRLRIKSKSDSSTQHRQYLLISDFLDLANLGIQEEAALATNWIKDRPEGWTLRWRPGRADLKAVYCKTQLQTSTTQSTNANLWLMETIDPSRQSIGNCKGFFPHVAVLRRHFVAECALPVLYVTSRHPRSRFWHLCGQRWIPCLGAPLENPFKWGFVL